MIYLRGKNKENIMKKTEKTKSNSYLFWGSIGLAVGCFAYVLSGKVWFLILGVLATTLAMIFKS